MAQPIEEADGEASGGLWLGGEAVVRRYPRKRSLSIPITRTITGLLGLALALGCAGGFWLGHLLCERKLRKSRH